MPGTFNEAQAEKMVIDACIAAGWQYVQADDLPRDYGDVLVDSMVKAALIRLNPCIDEIQNAFTVALLQHIHDAFNVLLLGHDA